MNLNSSSLYEIKNNRNGCEVFYFVKGKVSYTKFLTKNKVIYVWGENISPSVWLKLQKGNFWCVEYSLTSENTEG